jgi:Kef-type K+ transport system membrane component KefB
MIAGVIMGPSLFGLFFPAWQQVIFPKDSLKILYVLAQFGVGLYMFLIGTEFKVDLFRAKVRSAASVSFAGMVAPFILGGLLALWIRRVPGLFSDKATDFEAVLFLGAAIMVIMAIVTTLMASPVFELVYRKKLAAVTDPGTAPANI